MNFNDLLIDREHKFSIGIETTTGKRYVSIPVANKFVDYEEYYEIAADEFAEFRFHVEPALAFVTRCRARLEDARLIIQPGRDRGAPV